MNAHWLAVVAVCAATTCLADPTVRVAPREGVPWVGELTAMRDNVLRLRRNGEAVSVPLADVRRIEFLPPQPEASEERKDRLESLREELVSGSPLEALDRAEQIVKDDPALALRAMREMRGELRSRDLNLDERRRRRLAVAALTALLRRGEAQPEGLDRLAELYPGDAEVEAFARRIEEIRRRRLERLQENEEE